MKTSYKVLIVIGVAVCLLLGFGFWKNKKMNEELKTWDKVKTYIDGDLKGDLKKLHSLSDEEYMQCAVGIWIMANIPEEDVKKLFNIRESLAYKNEALEENMEKLRKNQNFMRWCFIRRVKQNKYYWECEFMLDNVKTLKEVPDSFVLSETEKSVVKAFCEKHKSGEAVFKTKIFGGKMTIIENAVKKFTSCI